MRIRFLVLFLLFLITPGLTGNAWSEGGPYTIMTLASEIMREWVADFEGAPRAKICEVTASEIPVSGSFSLLWRLNYVPAERSQGTCSNSWVWCGTGIMEIALQTQGGVFDRLSIQYLNSCLGPDYACCSGNLTRLAGFYSWMGQAIPWANLNGYWQDGNRSCTDGCSLVPGSSIGTEFGYPIESINDESISTHGIGSAAAISNIKNILHQGKAVLFSMWLPTGADWNSFFSFWENRTEDATWDPGLSCEHVWDTGGGGHSLLCVGYNDEGPDNRYWIMVNSWGTAGGGRPNGVCRISMDMNYDCMHHQGDAYYSFYWQTLDLKYRPIPARISVIATDSEASESGTNGGSFLLTRTGRTDSDLAVKYHVSGTAKNGKDYEMLSMTATIPAGSDSITIPIVPIDDYDLEETESVTINIIPGSSYTVTPLESATVEIADDDFDPIVTIEAADAEASEKGRDFGRLRISRSGHTVSALTVYYETSGTATNGGDYSRLQRSVVIPAGSASVDVTVSPINDKEVEGDEHVTLTLQPGFRYFMGSPGDATVVIKDDDKNPKISVRGLVFASETKNKFGQFMIMRVGASTSTLQIDYAVEGTAENGVDFEIQSGPVSLPAGQSSKIIKIFPIDDPDHEGDETVTIRLLNNPSYDIDPSRSSATLSIKDND